MGSIGHSSISTISQAAGDTPAPVERASAPGTVDDIIDRYGLRTRTMAKTRSSKICLVKRRTRSTRGTY